VIRKPPELPPAVARAFDGHKDVLRCQAGPIQASVST